MCVSSNICNIMCGQSLCVLRFGADSRFCLGQSGGWKLEALFTVHQGVHHCTTVTNRQFGRSLLDQTFGNIVKSDTKNI